MNYREPAIEELDLVSSYMEELIKRDRLLTKEEFRKYRTNPHYTKLLKGTLRNMSRAFMLYKEHLTEGGEDFGKDESLEEQLKGLGRIAEAKLTLLELDVESFPYSIEAFVRIINLFISSRELRK